MSLDLLDNEKLHYNKNSNLVPTDPWVIAAISILSAYNGDFINSIETKNTISEIESGLSTMWGITDQITFNERASRLLAGNTSANYHQQHLTYIKSFVSSIEKAPGLIKLVVNALPNTGLIYYQVKNKMDVRKIAQELGEEDSTQVTEMLANALVWSKELQNKGIGTLDNSRNLFAWDAVRLVNICRWALLVGYIDQATFDQFCNAVKPKLQAIYDNWQQVGLDFIIGGLIWNSEESRITGLSRGIKLMLDDLNSPINTTPLK